MIHESAFRSTMVAHAWYDDEKRRLKVEFVDGTPWEYFNVTPMTWNDFKNAASAGHFVNTVLNGHSNGPT